MLYSQKLDSPLKYMHRCVAIFRDKQNQPAGFALGSIEGRVAIHYINTPNPYVCVCLCAFTLQHVHARLHVRMCVVCVRVCAYVFLCG